MAWVRRCKTETCKIVKRSNNICPTGYLLNKREELNSFTSFLLFSRLNTAITENSLKKVTWIAVSFQ